MPNISGGGGGGIRSATVTLTDAQIKALPTTPVQMIAAQGAGTFVVPLMAWIVSDTTAGAYTNFNATDPTNPYKSSVYLAWDALNNFNDATGPAPVEDWLSLTQRAVAYLSPVSANLQQVAGALSVESGLVSAVGRTASTGYDNASISVVGQNNTKGNFTGGDPANTLKATVFYIVIAG